MTITIPTLPIPLIGAIVMTWLGLRAWRAGRSGPLFLSLIAICAWQSAVIALHHHYGLLWLRGVQPVGAALIPPLAWLALQDSGIRAVRPRDAVHLWPPITVLVTLALWPLAIDAIILLAFLGYGAAILIVLRHGSDALPRSRLQGGDHAARLWRLIGAGLILSSLSELLIIAAFTSGHSGWVGWIIGGYSAGSLLAIGVLSLSTALTAVSTPNTETPDTEAAPRNSAPLDSPEQTADDTALVARLHDLLAREPLYHDPDLTLARLGRRLGVPAKTLSAAINRQTGENVSRFINALRIAEVCERLRAGANITDAMLESGFNTKSNFNREFRRVTGLSPSEWRETVAFSLPHAAPLPIPGLRQTRG